MLAASAAAGSAAYAAMVSLLARWPSIVRARGSGGAARPVLVLAGAAVLVVVALGCWVRSSALAPRALVALSAVGFGTAWVLWGLLEQHVLRTFDVAPGSATSGLWDALFHGIGIVTAGLGASLLSAASLRAAPGTPGGRPGGVA